MEVDAMSTVVAAIDGGLATTPVLACAQAMGHILHSDVLAVHVRTDREMTPRTFAARAGLPLRILHGPVLDLLVAAGTAPDVAALVIGARGLAADPRPLGGTATAVATRWSKPVVVVPPHAEPRTEFKRVLVPLEGTTASSQAPRSLIELAPGYQLDVVVLHILGPDSIPSFMDQPQHWHAAWAREFVARYCPFGIDEVELRTRVGRPEQIVAEAAHEYGCDLIALGWSQDLAEGHARVVQSTLRHSPLPVALIPVRTDEPVVRSPADLAGAGRSIPSQLKDGGDPASGGVPSVGALAGWVRR
jgi:nucleotide-binding universal stress UspA family protein